MYYYRMHSYKNYQHTFGIIKPDAVNRNLIGAILSLIEKEFKIIDLRLENLGEDFLNVFYSEHSSKPFFSSLISYTKGPAVLMILEGENAIEDYRKLLGPTNPKEANKLTIRGTFGISIDQNSAHGSASEIEAKREIEIYNRFFKSYIK